MRLIKSKSEKILRIGEEKMKETLCPCGAENVELIIDPISGDIGCEECSIICDECGRLIYTEELGEYCHYCGCHL